MVDFSAIGGLVLAIGLLVTTWPTQERAFVWIGLAVAVLTLLGGAVARRMVWVTGRLDGETLWLYGVAPDFARDVETLAPKNLDQNVSRKRVAAALLIGAVVVLGVLFFLTFDLQA